MTNVDVEQAGIATHVVCEPIDLEAVNSGPMTLVSRYRTAYQSCLTHSVTSADVARRMNAGMQRSSICGEEWSYACSVATVCYWRK